ncbi:MAG: imidazole glycerol phosphate synthase subunit HisH [bacterium]|nr:imidazole glycerol phosphate synthase subunit HisH [bacterium]
MKIAIIDYGASNLQSVANALTSLGRSFEIINNPKKLVDFDKVILPGVGAAGSAMEKLKESGFAEILPKLKVPTLGVCLGLQLFADFSSEGNTKCLSIVPGEVKKFKTELKVPHMGWNKVELTKESPLTSGIPNNSFFYFVHSYYLESEDKFVIGRTAYGINFPAIIQKDNFYAVQFHPEKSGELGLKLLANFCDL